jgi:hypothetical protein
VSVTNDALKQAIGAKNKHSKFPSVAVQ